MRIICSREAAQGTEVRDYEAIYKGSWQPIRSKHRTALHRG